MKARKKAWHKRGLSRSRARRSRRGQKKSRQGQKTSRPGQKKK